MRNLFAALVAAFAFSSANAAICVPGVVPNATLYKNYTLTWSHALNPNNCIINSYVVDIINVEEQIELQYIVGRTSLSFYLNNLDMCKMYRFEIHALTNENVLGPALSYSAATSVKSNTNMSLDLLQADVLDDQIDLSWNLTTIGLDKCVTYYRVVYWNENQKPRDVYVTSKNFSLKGEVPCMAYNFQVSAIIANPDIEGPIREIVAKAAAETPRVPTLVSLTTTRISVNMVWRLEAYALNHCNLTSVLINTPGAPSNLTAIVIPVRDNISRHNVNVTLTGLEPDNVYVSHVSVVNEAGSSRNVTVNFQTTDSFVFNTLTDLMW